MCYVTSYNKQKNTYVDDTISGGGRAMPKDATTTAL